MLSIVAGMMIAIGGIIFLTLSGLEGALLFSMGLLTILCLKLELFTGKAGLLATKEIKPGKLLEIWIGNFIGTLGMALMLLLTPRGAELSNKAMEIVAVRLANGFLVNLIYGIFCGMLMFMAVKTWQFTNGNPFYAMMPVISADVIGMITTRRGVAESEAIRLLYTSKLYEALEKEENKLWQYSTPMLYSLLEQEWETGMIQYPDV